MIKEKEAGVSVGIADTIARGTLFALASVGFIALVINNYKAAIIGGIAGLIAAGIYFYICSDEKSQPCKSLCSEIKLVFTGICSKLDSVGISSVDEFVGDGIATLSGWWQSLSATRYVEEIEKCWQERSISSNACLWTAAILGLLAITGFVLYQTFSWMVSISTFALAAATSILVVKNVLNLLSDETKAEIKNTIGEAYQGVINIFNGIGDGFSKRDTSVQTSM